jgi:hypothetical protein
VPSAPAHVDRHLTDSHLLQSARIFHSADDLIADIQGKLFRIQVKTSRRATDSPGHYAVQLATFGGNQSWTGVVKMFDPNRCDFLFVLVAEGRRWFIPSSEIEGSRAIVLGGAKYSEFQVGQTAPLVHYGDDGSKLDQDGRGSADVGESGETVNLVAKFLSGFESHLPHSQLSSPSASEDAGIAGGCSRTRMSANHQLTIPVRPFAAAELAVGDRFRVEAAGKGRVILTRIEEYVERYMKQLALDPGEPVAAGNEEE